MPKQSAKTYPSVTLKVLLTGYYPEIWRTFRVPVGITLSSLHNVIQLCMGWTNSHLHEFSDHGQRFTDLSMEEEFDDEALDTSAFALSRFVRDPGDEFTYTYDFGDHWVHRLTAIEFGTAAGTPAALCLDGARECPPEDVGGIHGFREFLAAMADVKHPEHDAMVEWCGGAFDPLAFDLHDTNLALKSVKVSTRLKRGKARAAATLW